MADGSQPNPSTGITLSKETTSPKVTLPPESSPPHPVTGWLGGMCSTPCLSLGQFWRAIPGPELTTGLAEATVNSSTPSPDPPSLSPHRCCFWGHSYTPKPLAHKSQRLFPRETDPQLGVEERAESKVAPRFPAWGSRWCHPPRWGTQEKMWSWSRFSGKDTFWRC